MGQAENWDSEYIERMGFLFLCPKRGTPEKPTKVIVNKMFLQELEAPIRQVELDLLTSTTFFSSFLEIKPVMAMTKILDPSTELSGWKRERH